MLKFVDHIEKNSMWKHCKRWNEEEVDDERSVSEDLD